MSIQGVVVQFMYIASHGVFVVTPNRSRRLANSSIIRSYAIVSQVGKSLNEMPPRVSVAISPFAL